MIQRDALEVLNAPQDGANLLAGLANTGINPKMYRIGDVVRRAGEIVVLAEIAAILGRDIASVHEAIVRCGLFDEVKIAGAWSRDLLPLIVHVLGEGGSRDPNTSIHPDSNNDETWGPRGDG